MSVLKYTEGIQRRNYNDISIENNNISSILDCFFKQILCVQSKNSRRIRVSSRSKKKIKFKITTPKNIRVIYSS